VKTVRVDTAEEMREAVLGEFEGADALVMAAAVADFRPEEAVSGKLKKESAPPHVRLVPTADILGEVAGRKGRRVVVGFAAETEDLESSGRAKLEGKNLDLVVVNEVGRDDTGFGSETNDAMILSRAGIEETRRTWSKRELAAAVCERVAALLLQRR
jgi:phosphopantothenoylcysteine decarboxylase/phosphopantothenate--cysteine ligase